MESLGVKVWERRKSDTKRFTRGRRGSYLRL
jgi:hypothetical protein